MNVLLVYRHVDGKRNNIKEKEKVERKNKISVTKVFTYLKIFALLSWKIFDIFFANLFVRIIRRYCNLFLFFFCNISAFLNFVLRVNLLVITTWKYITYIRYKWSVECADRKSQSNEGISFIGRNRDASSLVKYRLYITLTRPMFVYINISYILHFRFFLH